MRRPEQANSPGLLQQTGSVDVFIAYSHKDRRMAVELKNHLASLKRQDDISVWYDGCITVGQKWEHEIANYLNSAKLILLLISSDFIASDYCYERELKQALERYNRGEALVVPVLLRPTVEWRKEAFAQLQVLPEGGKPVTKWSRRDDAYVSIAEGIHKAVTTEKIPSTTQVMLRKSEASEAQLWQNIQKYLKHLQEALRQHEAEIRRISVPIIYRNDFDTTARLYVNYLENNYRYAQLYVEVRSRLVKIIFLEPFREDDERSTVNLLLHRLVEFEHIAFFIEVKEGSYYVGNILKDAYQLYHALASSRHSTLCADDLANLKLKVTGGLNETLVPFTGGAERVFNVPEDILAVVSGFFDKWLSEITRILYKGGPCRHCNDTKHKMSRYGLIHIVGQFQSFKLAE